MVAELLASSTTSLRDWVVRHALPFWATSGFDGEHGRFEERLSLKGERMPDAPLRLMVQARQIYVYALAYRKNWYPDALALVELAYSSMLRDFHMRDGYGGWIYSIHRDGAIADPQRDLYAHAFALLSIASYVQATGKRTALALADETLAFMEVSLKAPGGGYVEALPTGNAFRRQNPHMHLFEALLALWSSSADRTYLTKAANLFDLFANRFFRPDPGVLGEYFDADLRPAGGAAGNVVEPGHHYEWIWLLRRFECKSGRSVQPYVNSLYAHADTYGQDSAGLVVDEVLADGSHRTLSRRLWPVAEAIKANLAEARQGRGSTSLKAATLANLLSKHFLTAEPLGGWIDRLDHNGMPSTDVMPASSFYHIICAIDELDRFMAESST
ncbi:MAG: AGE family epimerase/isomerase [Reyranella sp.]|nr:AGE family epimerase/isomerase [Reyranella sp.]